MFKTKRKSQPPTILPSSSSLSRTTFLVSPSSACHLLVIIIIIFHQSSSTSVSPQRNNYKKISNVNNEMIENIVNTTRSSRPKQFLGYFRCCCYHLCSCTCECSIPPNTFQYGHASSIFNRQNCASTSSINSSYYRR